MNLILKVDYLFGLKSATVAPVNSSNSIVPGLSELALNILAPLISKTGDV